MIVYDYPQQFINDTYEGRENNNNNNSSSGSSNIREQVYHTNHLNVLVSWGKPWAVNKCN